MRVLANANALTSTWQPQQWIATALVISLQLVCCNAYDFDCRAVWDRPSANNSLLDCLRHFAETDFGMLVPPLIPAVLVVSLLFAFPVAYVCRIFGSCGSNEVRPGAGCCCDGEEWDEVEDEVKLLAYPRQYVKRTKLIIFLAVVASIGGVALVSYGVKVSLDAFDEILKDAKKDILDWAHDMMDTVEVSTRDANGNYIPPITSETFVPFQDLLDWGNSIYSDVDKFLASYGNAIVIVAICASAVPTVCMLLVLALAGCSLRNVLPRLFQWVYYFLGVLVGIIGTVLTTLGIIGYCVCGEAELQQWKTPGLFQWWAVPTCKDVAVVGEAASMLREMEVENSVEACRQMLSVCDASESYAWWYDPSASSPSPTTSTTSPSVIFVCPLSDEASLYEYCGSFDGMNKTVMEMTFKQHTDAICPSAVCHTFADCAEHCTDQSAKNRTREALAMIRFAANATVIIDRYVPELDCDVIVTRFVGPLTNAQRCTDLSFGLLAMGAGATFACLVFIWGIILLCKGQKLFFDRRSLISDAVVEIEVMPSQRPPGYDYWQKRSKGRPPTL